MSGYSYDEYSVRFRNAEETLRKKGMKTFNPVRWGWLLRHVPYKVALAFDIFAMCFCDSIYLLEGWTESAGAMAEHRFAVTTGMIILYER